MWFPLTLDAMRKRPIFSQHPMNMDTAVVGRLFAHLLLALALCSSSPSVADTWHEAHPAIHPAGNFRAAMAADERRGVVVLFGGLEYGFEHTNKTWEWDGTTWFQASPLYSPPAQSEIAMAYNSDTGKIVMIGQACPPSVRATETWEYDGVTWSRLTTATSPPPRSNVQLVFDSGRGVFVFYGGRVLLDSPGYIYVGQRDTWEFDGTEWTERITADAPQSSMGSMVYDRERERTFYFGEYTGTTDSNESWQYDGVNWTKLNPVHSPSARHETTMYFDPIASVTVLFGGSLPEGGDHYLNETWIWDGTDWRESSATTLPPYRKAAMSAFDPLRNRGVLFGGFTGWNALDDTWEFELEAVPATFTPTRTTTPSSTETARPTATSTPSPSPTPNAALTPSLSATASPSATAPSTETAVPGSSPSFSPTQAVPLIPLPTLSPETHTPAAAPTSMPAESPVPPHAPGENAPSGEWCVERSYSAEVDALSRQHALLISLGREVSNEISGRIAAASARARASRHNDASTIRSFNTELKRFIRAGGRQLQELPRSVFVCGVNTVCPAASHERAVRLYTASVRSASSALSSAIRYLQLRSENSRKKASQFDSRRARLVRASLDSIGALPNRAMCDDRP